MNIVDTIVNSFNDAIGDMVAALPALLSALILLVVGWILSGIIGRIVSGLLERVGVDRMFAQHGQGVYGSAGQNFKPSSVAGSVIKWFIRLIFIVAAANLLGLPQVTNLLNEMILFLPTLLVAAIILLVAPLIGRFVRGIIEVGAGNMGFSNAPLLGRLAEVAIIVFAVLIAINQVGIAANLVNTLFIGVVGALALAFGLAFGLGGREVAAQLTQKWYDQSQQAAQKVQQARQSQAASQPPAQPTVRTTTPPPAGAGGSAPSPVRPR